jgi:hypothetical protein
MSNTTVTLTVTDPSGQLWTNGFVTWQLYAKKPVFFNGVALVDSDFLPQSIALDSSGFATFSVKDCGQMTPRPQVYRITVNPNAYTEGITVYSFITGASQDISGQINAAILAPTVIPATIPFAYRDSNIELQNGVGEFYYNTGVLRGFRYYDLGAWHPLGGTAVEINGVPSPNPANFVDSATVTWAIVGGNVVATSAGGGITQLHDDVLAGPGSGDVSATVVMVHAFDNSGGGNPNSKFFIETEVPPAPGATTPSVGLYAKNIFNNTGVFGKVALYYDNDNLSEWVLQFIDETNVNSYIYGDNDALYLINDHSGFSGNPQWIFGNKYDGTGQILALYYDGTQGYQLGTKFGPTPSFFILGNSGDTVEIAGVSPAFCLPGMSFDSAYSATPATIIQKGAPGGPSSLDSLQFQGMGGFRFAAGATFTDAITVEFGLVANQCRMGFSDNTVATFVNGGSQFVKALGVPTCNAIGSPAFGTVYQNTTGMSVSISWTGITNGSGVGNITVLIGPTNPPTNTILINENTASVNAAEVGVTFGVPPNWFFKLTSSGDVTGVGRAFITTLP